MEESEDNLSAEDVRLEDGYVKAKPKKRSLVERELETNLTARVTSPILNSDGTSTSRYGRARRLKTEADFFDTDKAVSKCLKSPKHEIAKSPSKIQSPAYKMHASNSPIRVETPKRPESSLGSQIESIYSENISLSRFGSEEKKVARKFPKVYIRKDLIQTKEKEVDDTVVLIKNIFSPNNSITKSNTNYNFESSAEKKYSNGYMNTLSVVKTLDFDGNKKRKRDDKKSMLSKSELFEMEAKSEYQVGDLAWARMGTYPFWPCIITRDPLSGMFVKKKLFGRIERDVMHVTFFGDNGRRGWIVDSMLRNFLGQLEFETARMNFTAEAKKKDHRLYAAYFISEKKTPQWQISVEEAETLMREPKRLRIEILNDMIEKSRALKTTPKIERGRKVTRTNSDVSLSESLYDTLFSEDDSKANETERSRSKSRNRSLDVSEVVTACLDNMAAKTGITKIQRQSHMDRWLQKAKSKTPEKSHYKSQKSCSKSKKKSKETRTSKRSASFNKLHDHDYSQKYSPRNSPIIIDEVEIEYNNAEIFNIEPGSGIGIISKVETLCGKNENNEILDKIFEKASIEPNNSVKSLELESSNNINHESKLVFSESISDLNSVNITNEIKKTSIYKIPDVTDNNILDNIFATDDSSSDMDTNNESIDPNNETIDPNNEIINSNNETIDQNNESIDLNNETIDLNDKTIDPNNEINRKLMNLNKANVSVNEENHENTYNYNQEDNTDVQVNKNTKSTTEDVDSIQLDIDINSIDALMLDRNSCNAKCNTNEDIKDSSGQVEFVNKNMIETNPSNEMETNEILENIVEKVETCSKIENKTNKTRINLSLKKNVNQIENIDRKKKIINECVKNNQVENGGMNNFIEFDKISSININNNQNTSDYDQDITETMQPNKMVVQDCTDNINIFKDTRFEDFDNLKDITQIDNPKPKEIESDTQTTKTDNSCNIKNNEIETDTEINQDCISVTSSDLSDLNQEVLKLSDENSKEINEEFLKVGNESNQEIILQNNYEMNKIYIQDGNLVNETQETSKQNSEIEKYQNYDENQEDHKENIEIEKNQKKIDYENKEIHKENIQIEKDQNYDEKQETHKENVEVEEDQKELGDEKQKTRNENIEREKDEKQETHKDNIGVKKNEKELVDEKQETHNENIEIEKDEKELVDEKQEIHKENVETEKDEKELVDEKEETHKGNVEIEKDQKDDDNISIKSEGSEVSLNKRKRAKEKSLLDKKNVLEDPEFLKYLELRQDAVMDEHPELSQEDITNYLYKTWLYEENLKSDIKKTDDLDQINLVKGVNLDAPVKKMRKKIKIDKEIEESTVKEKSKRKIIRPFYKEDFSDGDDSIEYFEIFKTTKELKGHVSNIKPDTLETDGTVLERIINVDEYMQDEYDDVEEYFRQLTAPKANVFKGYTREKVCEVCEKVGNLVKCKGCHSMFHIECDKKEVVVIDCPTPTRGRKKKRKTRGRKPKEDAGQDSGSDDKSQDANASEEYLNMSMEEESHIIANADEFEALLAANMQEMLKEQNIKYDFYSREELDWNDTHVGECKIVDIKPRMDSIELMDYSEFKCKNCQKYDPPICFVCKYPISPKEKQADRQKCQVAHCNKYYHLECLDHWPQTQFTHGSQVSRTNKFCEALSCPRHVCHTCVCDDPRGCKTRFSGDKLARCVRCPATYHTFTKCLPAGTQILTASHIICPRHYEHRPGKVPCHVNTGWCFICALGGSLICCEYCPTSFHAECLNIKPPEGGYMCEDCETGRLPLYGEMVWVKLGHYRWWPGIILHPSEIPDNIMAVKHSLGEFVVRFFGQYDYYWVNRGRVFPFQEGDSGKVSSQRSKIDAAFTMAMEHAQRACEILKSVAPNAEESSDIASSLLPPHYVKLRVNKPCGSLCGKKVDLEEGSLTQCECDPYDVDPCGPYTQCLNRMLLTECGPTCRAADRCNNRAFERRLYPRLEPYRTPHRGWGLRALEDIRAGRFVIEYVGELLDEDEFRRRMSRKHEVRDENFYFLTLDKERMIDAGPKGNLARFMNHSCEPNCETQKWTVLGDVRVGLFALCDIPANTELTFNYNLETSGIEKKRCMCGAKRCSGYIGAKPKQEEQPKKVKVQTKRTYKRRKEDSASQYKKRGRPLKPRELTDIEKDLLIIKNATSGLSSDSEGSRLSADSWRDNRAPKRKRSNLSTEEMSPKQAKSDEINTVY